MSTPEPAPVQCWPDTQALQDEGTYSPTDQATPPQSPMNREPGLSDPVLGLLAAVVDDLENVRIANENRYGHLTGTDIDKDGVRRGLRLSADPSSDRYDPSVQQLRDLITSIEAAEKQAIRNLEKSMQRHPLEPWRTRPENKGIGAKQLARLLAAIGDPYWNDTHNRPALVSELISYCGFAPVDVGTTSQGHQGTQSTPASGPDTPVRIAASRMRYRKANWNAEARKRAWLVAKSIETVGKGGRYRALYDDYRAVHDSDLHRTPCVRCGPSGHPAPVGSPLNKGHQQGRALRFVAKEVLKDLWREAKRLHEQA